MKKFNLKIKDNSGQWQTYGYATQWDGGGISISFKKDTLVKLLSDVELNIIPMNKDYINGNLWENKGVKDNYNSEQRIKQPTQEEINSSVEIVSDIPF